MSFFSTQSNKTFLLDVQADDLTEVDAASLEADAVAAIATPTPAFTAASSAVHSSAPVLTNGGASVFPIPGSRGP